MNEYHIVLFLWLLITALLSWLVPKKWQLDAISLSTLLFMISFYAWSALWLITGSLLVYSCVKLHRKRRSVLIASTISILTIVFLVSRAFIPYAMENNITIPVVMGLAYYTCRHIHFLVELYKGTITRVTMREYLHYQLFLPVIVAGPINRFHHFTRQCRRRRLDRFDTTAGLERILYGFVKVVVLGNFLINAKFDPMLAASVGDGFGGLFLLSASHWIYLYAQFSGYTDIALGFSLIMGFRIEENFNKPYLAKNLIEFWQRWHITLSAWCRDYVFAPVQAKTRNQLAAVFAAMIAIGLWHEVSLYYFIWGLYHALGITLCRLYQLSSDPLRLAALPASVRANITRGATLAWLAAGMPIITLIMSSVRIA